MGRLRQIIATAALGVVVVAAAAGPALAQEDPAAPAPPAPAEVAPPAEAPPPPEERGALAAGLADLDVLVATAERDLAYLELPAHDQKLAAARQVEAEAAAAREAAIERLEQAREAVRAYAARAYKAAGTSTHLDSVLASKDVTELGSRLQLLEHAQRAGRDNVRAEQAALDRAERRLDDRIDDREDVEAARDAAYAAARAADDTLAGAQELAARLHADPAGAAETDQASPTILGPSRLTADDLARFVVESGYTPRLTVPLEELAKLFIEEGAAEGVRGDIAFAQSILETGGFNFPDFGQVRITDNNFAGIGACDSCDTGFAFGDARAGVRAQMQLLHAYADEKLTTQKLAYPPVRVVPERLGVRGCCQTWIDLGGVWATGSFYGEKILSIYARMVTSAVGARLVWNAIVNGGAG